MKYQVLLIALLFFSCKKDYQVVVTYKIDEQEKTYSFHCDKIEVSYLENGEMFTQVVDTGWTHSFNHKKNTKVYLKVKPLCPESYVVGLGFLNNSWYYQAIATDQEPGEFEADPPN
jgi:hypothetical protein